MKNKLTIKILLIAGLSLLLLIPLSMIQGVINERSGYRWQVEQDIANTWTGAQRLVGPVLSVPYEIRYEEKLWNKELEKYEIKPRSRWETAVIIPETVDVTGDIATETRQRGIYEVPVYTGLFTLNGVFAAESLSKIRADSKGFTRWGKPVLSLAISDVRGIGAKPTLLWNQEPVGFESGSMLAGIAQGVHAKLPKLTQESGFEFAVELELRGSRALSIVPIGKDARAQLRSPWPHPKFAGRFLPSERIVSAAGFEANWRTSSFSTSVEHNLQACVQGDCQALSNSAYGVDFIEPVDIYQKVTRATKYGILFILLTFVAFFLTETLSNASLHPVQYALVGFALSIFYLLLISLSEHVGFALAYSIATGCCSLLIGVYLTGVLGSAKQGFVYAAGITTLYGMLFTILRSEDFALLMGAVLLFAMLAAVMLMTRKVNWHAVGGRIDGSVAPGSRTGDETT